MRHGRRRGAREEGREPVRDVELPALPWLPCMRPTPSPALTREHHKLDAAAAVVICGGGGGGRCVACGGSTGSGQASLASLINEALPPAPGRRCSVPTHRRLCPALLTNDCRERHDGANHLQAAQQGCGTVGTARSASSHQDVALAWRIRMPLFRAAPVGLQAVAFNWRRTAAAEGAADRLFQATADAVGGGGGTCCGAVAAAARAAIIRLLRAALTSSECEDGRFRARKTAFSAHLEEAQPEGAGLHSFHAHDCCCWQRR